jgi:murein DD-endopeptidase MepM/ murein hydrolase activator NlpD
MNKDFLHLKKPMVFLFIFLCGFVLSSCQTDSRGENVVLDKNNESTEISPVKTIAPQPSSTNIQVSPTLITNTDTTSSENKDLVASNFVPTPLSNQFKSPLADIELEELSKIVSNPFDYAGDGKDEGHHGADFSFYQFKTFKKIENLPVQSIASGIIRSAITNRPPYGNMIMIETPLASLPIFLADRLQGQYPDSDLPYYTNLSCPKIQLDENLDRSNSLSLYILYAHLFSPPTEQIDSLINSGEKIGEVGNSGYSGNPHLHLEFRIGPSGHHFLNMAHYDNAATQDEIYNYCLWRVSGLFYQIDPVSTIEFYLQNR